MNATAKPISGRHDRQTTQCGKDAREGRDTGFSLLEQINKLKEKIERLGKGRSNSSIGMCSMADEAMNESGIEPDYSEDMEQQVQQESQEPQELQVNAKENTKENAKENAVEDQDMAEGA